VLGRFRFVQADSEELKKAIYRLRYRVYVEECGFERPEDHPDGFERDEYEPHAVHLAALDETGEVIGTIRIVRHSEKGFPIEHAAKIEFIGEKPPPERIGEVSRLTMSRSYRRRAENGLHGVESYLKKSEGGVLPDTGEMPAQAQYLVRKRPVVVLGLYRIMYHASKRLGLTHWYMITEKKVWYALRRYGFVFHQIGEPVEYHGTRIPYLGIIDEIESYLSSTNPDFFRMVLNGLEKEYHPKISTT
jgi:N-acyl amino acid synthase of PEP-CTERM/exosortase system